MPQLTVEGNDARSTNPEGFERPMRFVDLSVPLDDNRGWAPWWARTRVRRQGHRFGRLAMWSLFGVPGRLLKTGAGWANEQLSLSSHGTTHLDAPWHYAPTSEGHPAKTIDQVPLTWCYGPGVKLDLRHVPEGEAITAEHLQAASAQVTIRPGDIVLIQTGNDRFWGQPDYFRRGLGMSAQATRWLLDFGVHVVGIDSFSWDVPLPIAARRAKATGRRDLFWQGHYVGVDREYCHLERLTNLGQLPASGFTVCCFPLKVRGGSAGPARVVAILP